MRRRIFSALLIFSGCRIAFDPVHDAPAGIAPITQTLRLDRIAAPAGLIDHPLLVVLDDTRATRSRLGTNAETLRFYDETGRMLAHEIEQVGVEGGAPLVAWVRVPTISDTSTIVRMSYGAVPDAASAEPVWNASYEAIWHLAEDAGRDSTGNHPATAVGTTLVVDGGVGPSRHFRRSEKEYLSASASTLAPTAYTLAIWMNTDDVPGTSIYYSGLSRAHLTSSTNEMWLGDLEGDPQSECVIAAGQRFARGGAIPAATWTHLVVTIDASFQRLYQDGVIVDTGAVGGTPLATGNPILIGADNNGSVPAGQADTDWHNGMLDEARIERVVRSAEFIAYDHAVQRDLVISY